MKTVKRFFRKYFLTMVGIILLFLLLNALLYISMLVWAWKASNGPEISIHEVWDSVTVDETGSLTAAVGLEEGLKENDSWAMLLDDTGGSACRKNCPGATPPPMWPNSAGGI